MIKKAIMLVILTSLLVGCSADSDSKDSTKSVVAADYLLRSGRYVLTPDRADKMVETQMAVSKIARRNMSKIADTIDAKFKFDAALKEAAAEMGCLVDQKQVKENFTAVCKRAKEKLTEKQRGILRRMIEQELTAKSVYQAFEKTCKIEIAPSEVERRARLIGEVNAKSKATNDVQQARARECWRKIKNGELTFEEAVKVYDETENPNPNGEWSEFSIEAFGDDEKDLRDLLLRLKVGEVSPPALGDNGLVIVKMLGTGENRQANGVQIPAKTYRLARIFFHLYEIWPKQTSTELESDLRDIELKARWRAFVSNRIEKMAFEYGRNGENFAAWKRKYKKEVPNGK